MPATTGRASSGGGGAGVTWADDLAGSSNTHQKVVALSSTGIAGRVDVNCVGFVLNSAAALAAFSHATTAIAAGAPMYIRAQSSSLGGAAGGDLELAAGSGDFIGRVNLGANTSLPYAQTRTSGASGTLCLQRRVSAYARNDGDTADVFLWGTNSSNELRIGSSSGAATKSVYDTPTGTVHDLRVNGSTTVRVGAGYVDWGASSASAGLTRFPNNTDGVMFRNAANSANVAALSVDNADDLFVGLSNAGGAQAAILFLNGSSDVRIATGGSTRFQVTGSKIRAVLAAVEWPDTTVAPTLTHAQRASDSACSDLTITSQQPNAGATGANRSPGNLALVVPAAVGGATEGRAGVFVAGAESLRVEGTVADTETALLVRRNLAGVFSLERVSQGAVDSGGAGFRVLRVAN